MPVHPSEEEAPSNLTDMVAQQSSDSTASTHPIHTGDNKATGPSSESSTTQSSNTQSSSTQGSDYQAQANDMVNTISQKATEFAKTASTTATNLAGQAQAFVQQQMGGSSESVKPAPQNPGLTDNAAEQAKVFETNAEQQNK